MKPLRSLFFIFFLYIMTSGAFAFGSKESILEIFCTDNIDVTDFTYHAQITDVYDINKQMNIGIKRIINDIYFISDYTTGEEFGEVDANTMQFPALLTSSIVAWAQKNNGKPVWTKHAPVIAERITQFIRSQSSITYIPAVPVQNNRMQDINAGQSAVIVPDNEEKEIANNTIPVSPPLNIMSAGKISGSDMAGFMLKMNPSLNKRMNYVNELINLYITEAGYEGINYEIAFAQMCFHTNYLTFSGTFAKEKSNNFGGIVSSSNTKQIHNFPSMQEGVRAHIQHLKGYASAEPLKRDRVDPRYKEIETKFGLGASPAVNDLSNKWAEGDYSGKLKEILEALYSDL